jgi:ABC-2 type transport system ATP-binding protein
VKAHSSEITDVPAVDARGLTKSFGATRAVDGLDLTIPRGCIYGVLGPNGAGKTTTIRILATLTRPDAGTARVLGHDVVGEAAAVREKVCLTGQFASVDEDLTALENLVLLARLLGYSGHASRIRANELLQAFDLADASRRQVAQFSGGMRRRLDIAASLIVTPDLLFLDEPTTGLDPRSRNHVWQIVRAIVSAGTTVVLTTQYLDEADRLADRIAVIDHGRVIAEGPRAQLKASAAAGTVRVRLADPGQRDQAESTLTTALGVAMQAGQDPATLYAHIPHDGDGESARRAGRALVELSEAGIAVSDFTIGQPTLDEVFLALTGTRSQSPQITRR